MKASTYPEMFQLEQSHFWFTGKQAFINRAFTFCLLKNEKILDVGCGTGGTTQIMTKWGDVTGLEKNPQAASLARSRGLTVKVGSANKIPFQNSTFTVVTFFDVLYHKGINESQALKEAWRILEPGGHLFITDCATPSLWSVHDEIMDAKYRYTKQQLSTLVSSAGFTVDTLRSIYAILYPIFVLVRIIKKVFPSSPAISMPPNLINGICSILLSIESSVFPYVNPPFGSSIFIIAKKPL